MGWGRPGGGRVLLAVLAALAALALSPAGATAARFFEVPRYVGAGGQYGTVASGNPSIDGARGPGFQVVFGSRLRDRYPLYFDMRIGGVFVDVGPTPEIAYPSDRADYAVMAIGGLWAFRKPGPRAWRPWVSLHGTYHNFNWRRFSYSIDGLGFSPGAGMDFHVPPLGLLRVGLMANFFSATSLYDANSSGQSLLMSLDYLYVFGPRDER